MISSRQARRILFRVAAVAVECDQAREIGAERHQLLFLLLIERRRSQRRAGRHLSLDPLHVFERDVPASLELVGDQPVRWINGIVLPSGVSCLVASLL